MDAEAAVSAAATSPAAPPGRSRRARRRGIRSGVLSRTGAHPDFLASGSRHEIHIGHLLGRPHQPDRRQAGVAGVEIRRVRFRIVRPTRPVGAAARRPQRQGRQRPTDLALHRRREHRARSEERRVGKSVDLGGRRIIKKKKKKKEKKKKRKKKENTKKTTKEKKK